MKPTSAVSLVFQCNEINIITKTTCKIQLDMNSVNVDIESNIEYKINDNTTIIVNPPIKMYNNKTQIKLLNYHT